MFVTIEVMFSLILTQPKFLCTLNLENSWFKVKIACLLNKSYIVILVCVVGNKIC